MPPANWRNLAERLRWLGKNSNSEHIEVGAEIDRRHVEGRGHPARKVTLLYGEQQHHR